VENSRILVDTNILIDYFRKKRKKTTRLYFLNEQYRLTISTITEFEFLSGFSKLRVDLGNSIIKGFEILPFNSDCSRKAIEIYQELKARNLLIPPMDIFIAATAIVHQLPLATLNTKHFTRISPLELLPV